MSPLLLTCRQCLSGRGAWYHLDHFTGDVVFHSPLLQLEGREELGAGLVTLPG